MLPANIELSGVEMSLFNAMSREQVLKSVLSRVKENYDYILIDLYGRYEIVSGHRRTKACELAGLTSVKAEIKELSRDEAIILMVESNLQ